MTASRVKSTFPNPAVDMDCWPEGVVVRYLTVAGEALADRSITVDVRDAGVDGADGECRGCGASFGDSFYLSRSLDTAQHWAQEHAEKCRAMPRPEAGGR